MSGKFFSLLFTILIVFCVWYYHSYTESYSAEFEAEQKISRDTLELFTFENSRIWRTQMNEKSEVFITEGTVGEAILFNSGKIILNNGVEFSKTRSNIKLEGLKTQKINGFLTQKEGEKLFSQRYKEISWFEFPQEFSMELNGQTIVSSAMRFDLNKDIAQTDKPVQLTGNGLKLSGEGMSIIISKKDFSIHSKIRGQYVPTSK
jgi:Lipopolysaccharide-assembly, LptC-related